jgi:hypothetical protein
VGRGERGPLTKALTLHECWEAGRLSKIKGYQAFQGLESCGPLSRFLELFARRRIILGKSSRLQSAARVGILAFTGRDLHEHSCAEK